MLRHLFPLLLLALMWASPAFSQIYHFPPAPKKTRAVESILKKRVLFRPKATLTPLDSLPVAVDNSRNRFFPPIIDQQGGSCAQAAGIGYMFTYEMNRLLGRSAAESAQNRFAYQFAWNLLNDGQDQGGFVDEGLELARNYGMMTEADYGIIPTGEYRWASGYDKYLRAMHFRTAEVLTFSDSIPLIKRYLYDAGDGSPVGGILTFSGQSSWAIDNDYGGPSATGYHSLLYRLGTSGAHAVTIAGYDDLVEYTDEGGRTHKGAFIVVNTWGTYNHDNGRFYLPYDFFRDPAVSSFVLSNTLTGVRVKTYTPLVVARIGLSYSSRDDLYFGLACSDNPSQTGPGQFHYNQTFFQAGGDWPMQGRYRGSAFEFALDFTPFLIMPDARPTVYYLNINRGYKGRRKGEGEVSDFTVFDYRDTVATQYPCRRPLPLTLNDGSNILRITTRPLAVVSASPVRYADADGRFLNQTILLRTADGHPAKLEFTPAAAGDSGDVNIRFRVDK